MFKVLIPFRKSGWENRIRRVIFFNAQVLIPFRKTGWENLYPDVAAQGRKSLNPLQENGVGKRR